MTKKIDKIIAKLIWESYEIGLNSSLLNIEKKTFDIINQIKQYARDEWVLSEEELRKIIFDVVGKDIAEERLAKAIHSKMREKI